LSVGTYPDPLRQFAARSTLASIQPDSAGRLVPEKVRDELAARAALKGKSMQEFLRAELGARGCASVEAQAALK